MDNSERTGKILQLSDTRVALPLSECFAAFRMFHRFPNVSCA